jgi:hypothetical protein
MHSEMSYSVPDKITKDSNFTDIFWGVLERHVENSYGGVHPNHAAIVPVAADFFREKTNEKENPIKILEASYHTQSPFIPGTSRVSIPVESNQHLLGKRRISDQEAFSIASETLMYLDIGKKEGRLSRLNWGRVFGQIPSAALIVANERGFNPTIKIPSFANRFPNYFKGDLPLDNIPEGLEVGTIFIDGPVGDYCGKFSNGGRIMVNGSAGDKLGDVSKGVEYIVKEFSGKPTQVEDCDFYIGLDFKNGPHSLDLGLYSHEALKLKEKGCNIHTSFLFNKDAFKGDPSRSIEELVTFYGKKGEA